MVRPKLGSLVTSTGTQLSHLVLGGSPLFLAGQLKGNNKWTLGMSQEQANFGTMIRSDSWQQLSSNPSLQLCEDTEGVECSSSGLSRVFDFSSSGLKNVDCRVKHF